MRAEETGIFRQKTFAAAASVLFQCSVKIQPAPAPSLTARLLPWLAVFLVLGSVAFVRGRVLAMPLERDEGEYAYAGQLWSQGIPPYQLACNMKLPGTYFAYRSEEHTSELQSLRH